jgi:antitoxin VapB
MATIRAGRYCLAYANGIYLLLTMAKTKVAKLFRNGRSQAVRLPKEFRFEGDQVRVRRVKEGVLLEPMLTDVPKWFAELDRLREGGSFPARAKQRKSPIRRYFD